MSPELALRISAHNQASPTIKQVVTDANSAGAAIHQAGARAAVGMNMAGGATGNLAAQLNDIGVMLASGQSPLLLAIQQGTQINQIFAGMTGQQALKALQTAFLSLINPISMVTIGTIAAGAALFQYATSLNTDGRESTEVLQEQGDLIRRVAENWGDAVPALRAYVDQLDRAAEVGDTDAAYDALVNQQFAEAKQQLEDIRVGFADARISLQQFGASSDQIDALQQAFDDLRQRVAATEDPTREMEALQGLLATTVGSDTIPALTTLAVVLDTLAQGLAVTAAEAAALRAEQAALRDAASHIDVFNSNRDFMDEQERLNSLTREQLDLEREVARVHADARSSGAVVGEDQALELAQRRLEAEERRAELARSSSGSSLGDIERERDVTADLIAQLEHEVSLVGLSSQQKAVMNARRQAGAAATEQELQRIADLTNAIHEQEQAERALAQQWEDYSRIARSSIDSVIDALNDGKISAEEFTDILGDLGKMILNMGLNNLFGSFGAGGPLGALFGGGGGGGLWGVAGGFSGFPGMFGLPGMADGGTVGRSGLTWVGEDGPELLNLPAGAQVIPNADAIRLSSGGPSITINIDARGAERGAGPNIAREVRRVLPDVLREHNSNPLRRSS